MGVTKQDGDKLESDFVFCCCRSVRASFLVLTSHPASDFIGKCILHGDVQFSILLFLIRFSLEIRCLKVVAVELFQQSSCSCSSSSLGHLRFFTGSTFFSESTALISLFFINWVTFLTKAANSFFESLVLSFPCSSRTFCCSFLSCQSLCCLSTFQLAQ